MAPKITPQKTADSPRDRLNAPGAIEDICDRIINGERISAIAEAYGCHRATLNRWLAADPERKRQYDLARIESADAYADEADRIISEAKNKHQLGVARERAHHFRWLAAKRDPRRYGDKVELSGPNGGPIDHSLTVSFK